MVVAVGYVLVLAGCALAPPVLPQSPAGYADTPPRDVVVERGDAASGEMARAMAGSEGSGDVGSGVRDSDNPGGASSS
jgi:hypothetical protein